MNNILFAMGLSGYLIYLDFMLCVQHWQTNRPKNNKDCLV